MSHLDTDQTQIDSNSSTITAPCGEFESVDNSLPRGGPAKLPDQTDVSESTVKDDKVDHDKLPQIISMISDHDEGCGDSQQAADNAHAGDTSSGSSANTSGDNENDRKLPGFTPDATNILDMLSVELADSINTNLPHLVDEGDTHLNVADALTDTKSGDTDHNLANSVAYVPSVDHEALNPNVASPVADTKSVDDEDSGFNVADPLRATRLVDDEDSDLGTAKVSKNTLLVDHGHSDHNVADPLAHIPLVDNEVLNLNVASSSADTQSVNVKDLDTFAAKHSAYASSAEDDDSDSDLNVANTSANVPLVDNKDSDHNVDNATMKTLVVDEYNVAEPLDHIPLVDNPVSDLNTTNPLTKPKPLDNANSDTNVSNTSVSTQQSDDDDMPDLTPGDGVYSDLPDLVDDRSSKPTISHIGSTNSSSSFIAHNGQRCTRQPSDCENCKAILETQNHEWAREMSADLIKINERRRSERVQEVAPFSVKVDERQRGSAKKEVEDTAGGNLHIAVILLFLLVIAFMDNSWTTIITLLLLWHGLGVMRLVLNEAREQHRLSKNKHGNSIKNEAVEQVSGIVGAVTQALENGLEKLQFTEGTMLERMRSGALDQIKGDEGSVDKVRFEEVE